MRLAAGMAIYDNACCAYGAAAQVLVSQDASMFEEVVQRRVPQVLVGNYYVGCLGELTALEESGELDTPLTAR